MRPVFVGLAGVAVLVLAPTPALAHHKLNHVIPTAAQMEVRRAGRSPCPAASHSPHALLAPLVMERRCRHLRALAAANPNDAALRAACDRAARALTGRPC